MHVNHNENINYKYRYVDNNIQCYFKITFEQSDRSNFPLKITKHKSTFYLGSRDDEDNIVSHLQDSRRYSQSYNQHETISK